MHEIEIDDDVFRHLQEHAQPLIDSSNDVLRRLLDLEAREESASRRNEDRPTARRRTTRKAKKSRTRARSGSLLPGTAYEQPIMKALTGMGGKGAAREVIAAVGDELAELLTGPDQEPLNSGEVRWHNRAHFARLRLVERGLMKKDSPRGVWELTQAGMDVSA